MTNTPELNDRLIDRGQHPIFDTDTQTILEEIGYHLDEEHRRLYHENRDVNGLSGMDNALAISKKLDIAEILRKSSREWDGGYSIAGLIGTGDCFALRDPWGIRPFHFFRRRRSHSGGIGARSPHDRICQAGRGNKGDRTRRGRYRSGRLSGATLSNSRPVRAHVLLL